jgi:hypothetical protein
MGNLMPRWQFAVRLARGEITGTEIDLDALVGSNGDGSIEAVIAGLAPLLFGSAFPAETTREVAAAFRRAGAGDDADTARVVIAGLLASPAFQWK